MEQCFFVFHSFPPNFCRSKKFFQLFEGEEKLSDEYGLFLRIHLENKLRDNSKVATSAPNTEK